MSNNATRNVGAALLAGAMALSLAACGSGDDTDSGDADRTIRIGIIPPWSDTRLAAALMTYQAEHLGYDVEYEELSEPPFLFEAVAKGDVDIYPSAWADRNHVAFMDNYGDQLESLGAYYEDAISFLAVPTYSKLQSIEDIPKYADELGGRIYGIEPGAGLTKQMNEDVLPAYGLDEDENIEFMTSSTTAMLSQLDTAIKNNEEVVVTIWTPYWAAEAFDIRPLDDPKDAFGEAEDLHYVSRAGFADDYPDIAKWVDGFQIDQEQFGDLENLILNEYDEGQEMEAVEEWLKRNPGVLGD